MQHGLQRDEQQHAERKNDDRHERRRGDRERGDDLVFRRAGLGPYDIARVDRARDFHVDEVACDECEIPAARAEHRRIDEIFRHAAHKPHNADGKEALPERAHIRHGAEDVSHQKRRAEQQHERYAAGDAAIGMRPAVVGLKPDGLFLFVHCIPS